MRSESRCLLVWLLLHSRISAAASHFSQDLSSAFHSVCVCVQPAGKQEHNGGRSRASFSRTNSNCPPSCSDDRRSGSWCLRTARVNTQLSAPAAVWLPSSNTLSGAAHADDNDCACVRDNWQVFYYVMLFTGNAEVFSRNET